jgi:tetratricopeptide (TPR) repeat protein
MPFPSDPVPHRFQQQGAWNSFRWRCCVVALGIFLVPAPAQAMDWPVSNAATGSLARLAWLVPDTLPGELVAPTGTPVSDCREIGNPDRAVTACTAVNASKNLSKRTRAAALSNRCAAYQLKGMPDKAVRDCDRAVRLDPTNADALYNRGRLARIQGDFRGAISYYGGAIRLSPRTPLASAKAYNSRGDAYAQAGEADRAIADFNEAIRIHPAYAKAYFNRGAMLARRGELGPAIADYSEALKREPGLARALVARGNAYLALRKPRDAVADYAEALRLDKENALARKNLERASSIVSGDTAASSNLEFSQEPIAFE